MPVSPSLQRRFHHFLLTWPLRHLQGKIPRKVLSDFEEAVRGVTRARFEQVVLEFERQYGDGSYEERKEHLDQYLQDTARSERVDLEGVYAVILKARRARTESVEAAKMSEWQRKLFHEADLVRRQLGSATTRLRRLYGEATVYSSFGYGRNPLPPIDVEENAVMAHCDALMQALPEDPLMRAIPSPPQKPARVGRRPQTWLTDVHRELAKAGLTDKERRHELLVLAGLTVSRPGK
jgi:hypothetical protein